MSYNIFNKNASFQGTAKGESGSVEYLVDIHTDQSIVGAKTFNGPLTSSTGFDFGSGLVSGSGNISASFFYGDATHLTNAGTITSYSNHATDRLLAGGASSTSIKGLSTVTFTGGKLGVTGQISASLGVSGSTLHGNGLAITGLNANNIATGNLSAARLDLGSAGGLEDNSDSLRINLSSSTSGLSLSGDGLALDVATLTSDGTYSDTKTIIVQDGTGNPKKQPLTVLETNMTIAGGNITGTGVIPNAALPTLISVATLSASVMISGAFLEGDGSRLTNVGSTPSPAGANSQIQFNDDAAFAGDADLIFITGSNTLATSNLSASVNISGSSLYLQDEIYVGGQAFLDIETNVAANNASFNEITASSIISSSSDVYGHYFVGNGTRLNNVPMGNYDNSSIVFCDSTDKTITSNSSLQWTGTKLTSLGLSASADVQVGGHITGSGDIVLLGAGNSIIFDKPAGDGPSIATAGSNEMTLDGDNTLKLRADSYVTIQQNTTDKLNFNFGANKMVTAMVLSSSAAVSASIVDSLTGYKLGDQTVMDVDANITCGTIGGISFSGSSFVSASMVDSLTGYKIGNQAIVDSNANLTVGTIGSQNITIVYDSDVNDFALDFGAGAISGSGNISGSAFYGDGSNLTNPPPPNVRYHYLHAINSPGTQKSFLGIMQINGNTNSAVANYTKFIAPADGQLEYVLLTATDANSRPSDGDLIEFVMVQNEEANTWSRASLQVTGAFDIAYTIKQNNGTGQSSFRSKLDLRGNSPVVTGSTAFSEGDFLLFGMRTPGGTINDIGVTIAMTLSGSV